MDSCKYILVYVCHVVELLKVETFLWAINVRPTTLILCIDCVQWNLAIRTPLLSGHMQLSQGCTVFVMEMSRFISLWPMFTHKISFRMGLRKKKEEGK